MKKTKGGNSMQIMHMMRSRLFRRILLLVGIISLIGAVAGSTYWFYFLTPLKKLYDTQWLDNHSHYAIWAELQKSLKRNGGSHDEFMRLGYYGNEEWVRWLINKLPQSSDDGGMCCTVGLMYGALGIMTNQELAYKPDAWISWWERNKDKTQVEWIREGFEIHGVSLQSPLTQENIISLLRILGRKDIKRGHPYNAYRWLRDSFFVVDLSKFSYADLPEENPEEVFEGIKRYNYYRGYYPGGGAPGTLEITGPYKASRSCLNISKTGYVVFVNSLITASALVGIYCIYLTRKLKRSPQVQIEEQSDTSQDTYK
ncbi:MAG: hypothetical protein ACYTF1_05675 [Planctomycetota bacterium]